MNRIMKPIRQYTENVISNTWPEFIQSSMEHLSDKMDASDPEGLLTGEFHCLIEFIYREGFKDGLALYSWLD